jgi:hypothetical protein
VPAAVLPERYSLSTWHPWLVKVNRAYILL